MKKSIKKKNTASKNSNGLKRNIHELHDELKVKRHLFDLEMKNQWQKFEKDLYLIHSELKQLTPLAKKALEKSAIATKPLLIKINTSLQRILDGFERHHRT